MVRKRDIKATLLLILRTESSIGIMYIKNTRFSIIKTKYESNEFSYPPERTIIR